MEDQAIGVVLGMTGVIGLLGALAVAIVNVRFGCVLPMTAGLIVVTVLSLAICLADNPLVFSVGLVFWPAASFFSVPYSFGMAAELDPQGRVIAACGGSVLSGASIGPAFAGIFIVMQCWRR